METQQKIKRKLPVRLRSSDDNDRSSDENQDSPRKRTYKSLSLTQQQLMERINSLKDYPTYKKTKAKRIDLKSITESEGAPIVTTALSYGNKHNHNQVLMEYMKDIEQGEITTGSKFQQMQSQIRHKKSKIFLKSDPSFLSYKKVEEGEKNKIYRMINASQHQLRKEKDSKLEKKKKENERNGSLIEITPFPKELAKLKDKLKLLPMVAKENQVRVSHLSNPEIEDMNTISISSHAHKDGTITFQEKSQFKTNIKIKHSFDFSQRRGRNDYLKQLKDILDRSIDFTNCTKQGKDKLSLRSSCQSDVQMLCKSDIHLNVKSKMKNMQYWPSYPEYCLTQHDQKKLERLKAKVEVVNPNHPGLPQQVRELEAIIQQQIEQQQQFIEKDLINNEGNALGSKFRYLYELQKQNYKRNVQGLIKCRKEYRIERQREEIRANGLKRMKRMGLYETCKKQYEKQQKIDQQVF